MARRALEGDEPDDAKYAKFRSDVEAYIRRFVPESEVVPMERVGPLEFNWRGLARYWRTRATTTTRA